jgi:outer membrane protein assembly factor BamB
VAWTRHGVAADVPTPVFAEGRAYVLKDRGAVACIETKTGATLWSGEVEKSRQGFSSSRILAGRHLYITREDGKTFVLRQGDEFKQVASNALNESTFATPVFVNGQILIRTQQHLYCIGTARN